MLNHHPTYWKVLLSLCYIVGIVIFIMYLFCLRNQIALTGYFFIYKVTDEDVVFLEPDSCRARVRNGNSSDFSEDTIKTRLERRFISSPFRQFGSCFGVFDIAGKTQFTYIIEKYLIHLHWLRNMIVQGHQRLALLPTFLGFVQINSIICTYIVCM